MILACYLCDDIACFHPDESPRFILCFACLMQVQWQVVKARETGYCLN
jgi:hypothetical protein